MLLWRPSTFKKTEDRLMLFQLHRLPVWKLEQKQAGGNKDTDLKPFMKNLREQKNPR